MKQKALFKMRDYNSEFGGSLLNKRKRKTQRPIGVKNAMKIVLRTDLQKSTQQERYSLQQNHRVGAKTKSLLKYRKQIDNLFILFAEKFGVKIYEKGLVSNHIHFVAKFSSRDQYKKFMRALTGTMAKQLKIKWHLRPWSRIVTWGRALKTAINYTFQNHLEAIGAIPYQPRPEDKKQTRELLRKSHFTCNATWS